MLLCQYDVVIALGLIAKARSVEYELNIRESPNPYPKFDIVNLYSFEQYPICESHLL